MARSLLEEGEGVPTLRPLWALMPYLWPKGRRDLKWRVVISLVCLLGAVAATGAYPLFMGWATNKLAVKPYYSIPLGITIVFIVSYAFGRILMQAMAQLRDGIFAKVQYHAMREVGVKTFAHLHSLSLRFHLERKTGGLSRVIERGTKGIDTLLSFAIFSIFPTIFVLIVFSVEMYATLNLASTLVMLVTVALYVWFTFAITRWRIQFRRDMNMSDQDANTKTVDSLLNYETVKYFNAEKHETARFDVSMEKFTNASIQSQTSLSVLNTGQAAIINVGMGIVLVLAAIAVKAGTRTLGDFATANAILLQLYVPLNLLGTVYREIVQALVDMDAMFRLLGQREEVKDKPGAPALKVSGGEIRFDNVVFAYEPARTVLKGISFAVPAGKTVAIVGPSGAGKSTISRILYRFYDIASGRVTIDGQDIRDVTQDSLRASIGIVPQDTVLFNDTVRYNIAYGRIGAADTEVKEAARLAQIDKFIRELPQAYEAMVGERGLKLSGGEKQRVAIARTILKNPPILLLDEATSALDTHTEREIQSALHEVSRNRTTLVIAHRLSTVVDADEILVLEKGEIVERGRHDDLVARKGAYAAMWNRQKRAEAARERVKKLESDPLATPGAVRTNPLAGE
ncbi:ABCB family ABC transporter ATP-binding protein/permease [Rhizomicrobium electricum]|uniref:ABC transporter ATP-binding protein/permease n=1 Tax=Rhizomicrobium electricum TaxID=480070 RepID=A0ABP3QAT1_9PROT|nr:ABC transporter ATP-binding protein/permease [Rhizomicrobium electricum]NIJ50485.1 ATP-binding cassette subfamily B protein [Rhizomicrobium electricum]